jgi:hypothetical protein
MLKCNKTQGGELGACELPHEGKRLSCDEKNRLFSKICGRTLAQASLQVDAIEKLS